MDPKVGLILVGSLGFLTLFAVEPLQPQKKTEKGYNPEPYFFQWKARFEEKMGWRPTSRI